MKSGSRPIQGVLEYPQHAAGCKGLWIKDTPGREPEILTGMAATGAQFMMFSTGRGAPQGFPCMPVIKICGNPNTYERMKNDMDLNAGVIIEGKNSINEVGEAAFEKMLRVLNGEMRPSSTLLPSISTVSDLSSDKRSTLPQNAVAPEIPIIPDATAFFMYFIFYFL